MYLNVSINKIYCKWNVERCWWLEIHKSVVIVHSPMAANCSSTFPCAAIYFSDMTFVAKYVEWGHWNFGSAIANKVRKLGLSTTLMGCRPWQIKSAVVLTSCFTCLLSLEYGTTLAMASWSVACCNPGSHCSLSFTSVTFLCSSGCLFKRWYVRLDMLVEYEIATVGCKAYNIPFYQ